MKTSIIVCAILLCGLDVRAEIKKADLGKEAPLTQEAALLQQVDTVSLYMSSDEVRFAPRLKEGGIIEVESTVLAPELIADRAGMAGYMSRVVRTFNSVLKERLPIYAPDVARDFNPARDVVFVVNAGSERTPVGIWKAGQFTAPAAGVAPEVPAPDESAPPKSKGCNCPAMVR